MNAFVLGLLCVASQGSEPAPTTVHGFEIPLPAGWTRKDDPAGAVVLQAPPWRPGAEADYMMLVLPAQPLQGSFWETHRAVFDEVVKGSGLTGLVAPIHEPSAPGAFIRSSTAGDDANKRIRAIRLYSARSEDGIECIVVFGQEDFVATGPMLHRTRVRKPLKEAPRTKIVEAYRRLQQQLATNVQRGEYLIGSVPYDRILLRDDGVADFTAHYPEGYAASAVPPKVDAKLQHGSYGSWKAEGEKELHVVRRAGKPAEVYVRENGKLRLGDQVWEPMPSVDGLKLEGRWLLPGTPLRIDFQAGRFSDEGLLADVGSFPVYAWAGSRIVSLAKPPVRGSGIFEIRDYTLLLKYDDGKLWSSDFSTFGADPKDLSKLLLRTGLLQREP